MGFRKQKLACVGVAPETVHYNRANHFGDVTANTSRKKTQSEKTQRDIKAPLAVLLAAPLAALLEAISAAQLTTRLTAHLAARKAFLPHRVQRTFCMQISATLRAALLGAFFSVSGARPAPSLAAVC